MRSSWKLGQVAGIDLFLHPSALLLWFFAAGTSGQGLIDILPLVVALFTSIVLHELGHALMARRYGIGTQDITLYLIGGVARLKRMPRAAGPELLIALAGPAVNVAIAVVLLLVIRVSERLDLPTLLWKEIFGLNVGLVLFNLLPVFPMDGGRVCRALLSGWLGRVRATEIAAVLGQVLAVLGGVTAVGMGWWSGVFVAIFVYLAAGRERAQVWAEARHHDQGGLTDPPAPPTGFRWTTRGDGVWRLVPIMGRARTWGQS